MRFELGRDIFLAERFNATARLATGLRVPGGTSTGRAVRNSCEITKALPELLGTSRVDSCDVTEKSSKAR